MNYLEERAIEYKQLEKDAVRCLVEWKLDDFLNKIQKLKQIKNEIKIGLMEKPLVEVENIETRKILISINQNEELPLEKSYKNSVIGDFLREEFTDNELSEIGSDIFYSWFSHYEYVKGMSKIGALIINCGDLPENLDKFIDEARHCFAFQQYNSVLSLSRSILEVTIKGLATRHGILPKEEEKLKHLENYRTSLNFLIDEVAKLRPYRSFGPRLHWIRRRTNFAIHNNKVVTEPEAAEILKETINATRDLLEINKV